MCCEISASALPEDKAIITDLGNFERVNCVFFEKIFQNGSSAKKRAETEEKTGQKNGEALAIFPPDE